MAGLPRPCLVLATAPPARPVLVGRKALAQRRAAAGRTARTHPRPALPARSLLAVSLVTAAVQWSIVGIGLRGERPASSCLASHGCVAPPSPACRPRPVEGAWLGRHDGARPADGCQLGAGAVLLKPSPPVRAPCRRSTRAREATAHEPADLHPVRPLGPARRLHRWVQRGAPAGACRRVRLRVLRPCWRCAAAGRSPMTGIRLASAPRRCSFRDVCHRFTQYRRDVLAAEPVRHQLWLPDHRLLQAGGWQQ